MRLALALLLLSGSAMAEEIALKGSLDAWLGARSRDPYAGEFDPTNRTFGIPEWSGFADLRTGGRASLGNFSLSARARQELEYGRVLRTLPVEEAWESETEFTLIEAQLTWAASDSLILSAGAQNYQWGPAELISPSNTIFHFLPEQRTLRWIEPARWIARGNYSIGSNWSLVAMIDAIDHKETVFLAVPFKPTALAKAEYRADTGNHYIGATVSQTFTRKFHWGEYGSYSIVEGLSIYGDFRHSRGSEAFYPVQNPDTSVSMLQTQVDSTKLYTLGVVGVRYEDRIDARIEYVYNGYGYDLAQSQLALRGVRTPSAQQGINFARLLAPGIELPARDLLYFSVRVPDLGPGREVTASARYVLSMTDQTGAIGGTGEWLLSDNASAFADLAYNHKGDGPGLVALLTTDVSAGIRLQF